MLFFGVNVKTSQSTEFELFITLRVVDRVALTALQTLTERLGYGEVITGLERREYYRVAVAGAEDEARVYLSDIVENTTLFANPNKETFTIQLVARPLSKDNRYVALVYPREGLYDESLCRRLSLDLGYDRVVAAGRGIAWTIELIAGEGRKRAEEILVARERTRGLLLNPHAEEYEIV